MATITIGGEAVAVSLENYRKLKTAWRYIEAATTNPGFVPGMDAIIGAVAVGSLPTGATEADIAAKIDWIDERLTGQEIPALKPFMNELLIEAGLAEKPGEPPAVVAAAAETVSTETSTPSSPS